MFHRIGNVVYKELIQISRDWMLVVFLVAAPVIQLSLLAWNTGEGIKNLSLAVFDGDRSRQSRELVRALDNTSELVLEHYADDLQQVYRLLDLGRADVGVVIPANFGGDLQGRTRVARVQVIAEGSNNISGRVALAAAEGAILEHAAGVLAPGGAPAAPIDFRADVRFNPTLSSRDYTIPAQIGLIVFQVTLTVASLGLTRERETGTLEQLIIMPLRRLELVVGKALPPLLITMADFVLMLAIAIQIFKTPMTGSLALLLALTALFAAAEIGWGLMLSTFARTQQQAVLFVFVQAMLDMAFSGFLVPVENLPRPLQLVSNFVPLRHYLVIVRSIMLKGAALDVLWPQAVALAVLGLAIGAVASFNIGQRLD